VTSCTANVPSVAFLPFPIPHYSPYKTLYRYLSSLDLSKSECNADTVHNAPSTLPHPTTYTMYVLTWMTGPYIAPISQRRLKTRYTASSDVCNSAQNVSTAITYMCVGMRYECWIEKKTEEKVEQLHSGFFFWGRLSRCVYQICIIYYVPSIHNIHQDKMQ